MANKLKTIITGATGMVGEGVLHECLLNEDVAEVLVIGRKTCSVVHPKLKEIIHSDFFDLSAIESQLSGYNACLFCLGISSVGVDADTYFGMTYTLTMHVAETLNLLNPDMTFCYISGGGTDSTEQGRVRWARVKGKTENDLMKLPFKAVYNFRPGALIPEEGAKNVLKFYKYFSWLVPVVKLFWPSSISTIKAMGQAMIKVSLQGYDKNIVEVR